LASAAEAKVWIAESDQVPGLATGAETLEELVEKLKVVIPELLAENGIPFEADNLPFTIEAQRSEYANVAAYSGELYAAPAPNLIETGRGQRRSIFLCIARGGFWPKSEATAIRRGVRFLRSICRRSPRSSTTGFGPKPSFPS
jgi:predicted RNase H-like HicB family nuclease